MWRRIWCTHLQIGKWVLVSSGMGVLAGLGITVFYEAVKWSTYLFLGVGAGFSPPVPLGEGSPVLGAVARRWMIPVLTTLGGLLSGWIIFRLAPESVGQGADDVIIEAYHHKKGGVRGRVSLAKVIAAVVTLGSGGSAGREGPAALAASGLAGVLGRVLRLDARAQRIIVAAGIGAGIGAILKVPLGGALLSSEILYLEGFEADVLMSSFVATMFSYTVFASITGFQPIFGFTRVHVPLDPLSLFYFLLLGVSCGLVGSLYPKMFYVTRDFFRQLRLPPWLKPGMGGLVVGIMGLFLPQVLGMGYGWLQIEMLKSFLPLMALVALVFAKILATSLTLGSGGSGGVMSPGLFIGGMVGAAGWRMLNLAAGHMPFPAEVFIVVGMLSLFGAVAHAPVSVLIMVAEMTGGYELLVPAMLSLGLADALVGCYTIYEAQVPTPADSPAHHLDYCLPLLKHTAVKEVMGPGLPWITPDWPLAWVRRVVLARKIQWLLVVREEGGNRLAGVITRDDLVRVPAERLCDTTAGQVMSAPPVVIGPENTLDQALTLMSDHDLSVLPVVAGRQLLGAVTRRTVIRTAILAVRRVGQSPSPKVQAGPGHGGAWPVARKFLFPAGPLEQDFPPRNRILKTGDQPPETKGPA